MAGHTRRRKRHDGGVSGREMEAGRTGAGVADSRVGPVECSAVRHAGNESSMDDGPKAVSQGFLGRVATSVGGALALVTWTGGSQSGGACQVEEEEEVVVVRHRAKRRIAAGRVAFVVVGVGAAAAAFGTGVPVALNSCYHHRRLRLGW